MKKHPQSILTDLDLAVARALYDRVELRWCHLCDDDEMWYEADERYHHRISPLVASDWMQEWCYQTPSGMWETVPNYSTNDYAAFRAYHAFCEKHGYDIDYSTYIGHKVETMKYKNWHMPDFVNPSPRVKWHWVRICPERAEYTERTFALGVAKCIESAQERLEEGRNEE